MKSSDVFVVDVDSASNVSRRRTKTLLTVDDSFTAVVKKEKPKSLFDRLFESKKSPSPLTSPSLVASPSSNASSSSSSAEDEPALFRSPLPDKEDKENEVCEKAVKKRKKPSKAALTARGRGRVFSDETLEFCNKPFKTDSKSTSNLSNELIRLAEQARMNLDDEVMTNISVDDDDDAVTVPLRRLSLVTSTPVHPSTRTTESEISAVDLFEPANRVQVREKKRVVFDSDDEKPTKKETKGGNGWRRTLHLARLSHFWRKTRDSSSIVVTNNTSRRKSRVSCKGLIEKVKHSILISTDLEPLDKLLNFLQQVKIGDFNSIYAEDVLTKTKKIGEGSYGEIFKLPKNFRPDLEVTTSPVLKVVPVGGSALVNGSSQTSLESILAEIIVSKEVNNVSGFVRLHDCQLVKGSYPRALLAEWDEFDAEKGSENERPDEKVLPDPDQLFVAIVYENAGRDLEKAELRNACQGLSVFKQVVHALAAAEKKLFFEHRDLHWGNILVRECEENEIEFDIGGQSFSVATERIRATIIDFSLSRLQTENGGERVFFDLESDPELFVAEGDDIQFGVYKEMRRETESDWGKFTPKTNVLWLEYLLTKLSTEVTYTKKRTKMHKNAMKTMKSLLGVVSTRENAFQVLQDL